MQEDAQIQKTDRTAAATVDDVDEADTETATLFYFYETLDSGHRGCFGVAAVVIMLHEECRRWP